MKSAPAAYACANSAAVAATLCLAFLAIRQATFLGELVTIPEAVPKLPPPSVPLGEDPSVRRCGVWLPPAAPGTVEELKARLAQIFDSPAFPFNRFGAGYNITQEEDDALDQATKAALGESADRSSRLDRPAFCLPSTYDGPNADALGQLFAPDGSGRVIAGDAVVDLGAGIGKALVAAAVVSNASLIRGIELGSSRYADGCRVLRKLEQEFAERPGLAAPGPRRRVELVQGDLFALPGGFWSDLPARVTIYSYCNCFPYRLIGRIFQYAADLDRESVQLLASKEPPDVVMPKGLRRAGFTGTMLSSFFERAPPGAGADLTHSLRGRRRFGLSL